MAARVVAKKGGVIGAAIDDDDYKDEISKP